MTINIPCSTCTELLEVEVNVTCAGRSDGGEFSYPTEWCVGYGVECDCGSVLSADALDIIVQSAPLAQYKRWTAAINHDLDEERNWDGCEI
jgi:hypothetical protein